MANVEIVTREDLHRFKQDLLNEIKSLLQTSCCLSPEKGSLKSYEVMKLLNVSAGTLQKLRNTNQLPFYMDGGVAKYEYDDVIRYKQERQNGHRKNRKNIPFFNG